MTPAFLSERDLAARWGVDPETVRRLRLAGKLRFFRPTGEKSIRYAIADVERYEHEQTTDQVVVGMKRARKGGRP
jgi:hypothetical protein